MNGSVSGSELRNNNEKIIKLMSQLKQQRDEMIFLIDKQQQEKTTIENEIERMSFKLILLTKSLGQRLQAKQNYDKTLMEIEGNYSSLVEVSGKLLSSINQEVCQLEEIMDKKTETGGLPKGSPGSTSNEDLPPDQESSEENLKNTKDKRKSSTGTNNEERTSNPTSDREPQPEEISNPTPDRDSKSSRSSEAKKLESAIEHFNQSQENKERGSNNSRKCSQNSTCSGGSRRSSASKSIEGYNQVDSPKSKGSVNVSYTAKVMTGKGSDDELRSYRDAYEKQHTS